MSDERGDIRSATLNLWTGFGMFVGGACGFIAVLIDGDPGEKQLLALSLMSLFGVVAGGVVGLLLGLGRTLFLYWRHEKTQ